MAHIIYNLYRTTHNIISGTYERHSNVVLGVIKPISHLACPVLILTSNGQSLTLWPLTPTSDPTVEVVNEMQDLRVLENQPAEFICQFSRPVKAEWKKNGQPLQPDGRRVVVEQDWSVARLYISHVSSEDRGTYSCEAEGTCVVASLHVEGELPSTWKEHQSLGSLLCSFIWGQINWSVADRHKFRAVWL